MEFDFEKNATVEKIEDVPEAYQGLYEQGENGYQLTEAAKPLAQNYTRTNVALEKERANKKRSNQESADRRHALNAVRSAAEEAGLEIGEEDDLSEVLKTHIADLQAKARNGEDLKVDLDKVRDTMKRQHAEDIANKDKEIAARDKALEKMLVSNAATSALMKAGDDGAVMLPHVASACQVVQDGTDNDGTPNYTVRVLDGDGDPRTDGQGGYLSVEGLVSELKQDSRYARVFNSAAPAGSGGRPGSPARKPASGRQRSAAEKISDGLARRGR